MKNKLKVILAHVGSVTKLNYTIWAYEDGVYEFGLSWPELDWSQDEIVLGQADSLDDIKKLIEKRELLILNGHSVL